jgi:hypothetical protein
VTQPSILSLAAKSSLSVRRNTQGKPDSVDSHIGV